MKKEKILGLLKKGLCGVLAAVVLVGGMPVVEVKAARDSYQVDISGTMYRSEVTKFLELLNNERASLGLEPFVLDDKAMAYAEYRAMESTFLMEHRRLDDSTSCYNNELTVDGLTIAENEVYLENAQNGVSSEYAEEMFSGWMNSSAHRAALLYDTSTDLRMGVAFYSSGDSSISDYGSQSNQAIWVALKGSEGSYSRGFNDSTVSRTYAVPQNYLNVNLTFDTQGVFYVGDTMKISPKYKQIKDGNLGFGHSYMNPSSGIWVSNDPDKVSIDANGNLRALAPTLEATVSFLVNGDPDKKYTYRVRVLEKEVHNASVTGVKYSQTGKNSVKLSWDKSSDAKGTYKYSVCYRKPNDEDNYLITETTGTSITLNMSSGESKDVVVSCLTYDASKGKWTTGVYSSPVTVKLDPNWSGGDSTPTVSKVATPTVAKSSYKSVKVSWKKVSGASGYQVYRSKSKSSGYSKLATTSSTSKVISANVGQGYYYKVRAYKKVNGKTYYGSFSTPKGYRNYMSKPSFSVSSPSKKKAKATWKKVSGASGYYVQFASNSSFTKSLKKYMVGSGTLSKTISSVPSGKYQYVRVSSYKTINGKRVYSKWSSAKRVKVK